MIVSVWPFDEPVRGSEETILIVAASPPAAEAAPVSADASIGDQIEQLVEMRDQGILTDDEFAAAKAKLLGV